MSAWQQRILEGFVAELGQLWIVTDPDNLLLDEGLLAELRQRGFGLLPFEDPVVFRAELEGSYRSAWRQGLPGPARAVILHLKADDASRLPWDYLQEARRVSLGLGEIFPKLAPGVIRDLGPEFMAPLFEAHTDYATQVLGETDTKNFVLLHVFRISPHLIRSEAELWRELLKLHQASNGLPESLAAHVEAVLRRKSVFDGLPVAELFASPGAVLRLLQEAWRRQLTVSGVGPSSDLIGDPIRHYATSVNVPFDDPGVWSAVDTLFLEGALRPVNVVGLPPDFPSRWHVGVVHNQTDLAALVMEGVKVLRSELPDDQSSHRDWLQYARKQGELLARLHSMEAARFEAVRAEVLALQLEADTRLQGWMPRHFSSLPTLSAVHAPVMVHHVPRYLARRRDAGESRIALLVFDGLALDQWARVRDHVAAGIPGVGFDETASFAWVPTLTSVSRQAIFSGNRPRDFASSIEVTAQEANHWTRFWADHNLRSNEVFFRKGIKRLHQLDGLMADLSSPDVKVAGIVVDMVDELVHDAKLGKRGIAKLIDMWCQDGFVDRLFRQLHGLGYQIYLTADHGNVEAVGTGRVNQGVIAELRGERARVYRSDALLEASIQACPSAVAMSLPGLPSDFLPLLAGPRAAFVTQGEELVAHGGISVEELIVPFVKVDMSGWVE